jgi:hypothetical protein
MVVNTEQLILPGPGSRHDGERDGASMGLASRGHEIRQTLISGADATPEISCATRHDVKVENTARNALDRNGVVHFRRRNRCHAERRLETDIRWCHEWSRDT